MVTTKTRNNGTPLGFYTSAEASRIAQVPLWTVHFWRRSGIVIPSVEWIDEQEKIHIGHTFETVVFLRLIRLLREKKIALPQSVKAVKSLRDRLGPPSKRWADAKIFADNKDVYVYDASDGWESTVATRSHQRVAEFFFGEEFRRLKERADALLIPEQFMDYVEIDPTIQNGLPIILDTSVLTNLVHKLKQQGYEYIDIEEMYPFIPSDKIIGAEEYETFLDQVGKN
jgi:uncharacterized protein (DUF433 family)